jgi:hypothetical protein
VCGYDLFLKGAGAVCAPVPGSGTSAGGTPLVIAVAGTGRSGRPRDLALLKIICAELHRAG